MACLFTSGTGMPLLLSGIPSLYFCYKLTKGS
jgi:hypothetical protein